MTNGPEAPRQDNTVIVVLLTILVIAVIVVAVLLTRDRGPQEIEIIPQIPEQVEPPSPQP